MTVNGQDVKKINLQKMLNVNFDSMSVLPEHEEVMSDGRAITVALREANIAGNIPNRFAESRFPKMLSEQENALRQFSLKNMNDGAVLLVGPTGTGKTTLSICAMHERAIKGFSCGLYLSIRFLLPMLRTSRSFTARENEYELLQKYSKTPFLVLDEIGTSTNIAEESEFLRTVIAGRYDNNLPTIFTTNLSPSNFKLLLLGKTRENFPTSEALNKFLEISSGDPIVNRLKSIMTTIVLDGESKRGIA